MANLGKSRSITKIIKIAFYKDDQEQQSFQLESSGRLRKDKARSLAEVSDLSK